MAFVENYYKYFSLGLSSYSVNISEFYDIITKSTGFQAVFDKVKTLAEAKKMSSLTDQVLMTKTSKMNLDFATNYVYVIISLKLCNSMNSAIITRKFASDGFNSILLEDLGKITKSTIEENKDKFLIFQSDFIIDTLHG